MNVNCAQPEFFGQTCRQMKWHLLRNTWLTGEHVWEWTLYKVIRIVRAHPKKTFVHGQKIGRKLVKKGKGRNCKEGQVRFKLRSGLRNGGEEIEDESTALESPVRGPAKIITPL